LSFQLVERILGNVTELTLGDRVLERVPIDSDAMARRIVRLSTSVGDLGLRLGDDDRLRDGDVVFADAARVIAVEVLPDDVLVVRPRGVREALAVAHALGNRHVPVLIEAETLIVRYAPALEALVRGLDVPVERTRLAPAIPFRHATAPHAH
jgi:urease accessory protein